MRNRAESIMGKSHSQIQITLSDTEEEKLIEALESFMNGAEISDEWEEVIPESAVNWLKDYVPKLAGVLSEDVLERTREVIRGSMMTGSTLQERMKALRESSETLQKMADARIESIARTEITRADSMGRLIEMKGNEDVIGVEFSAIMDDRTTDMCAERHGLVMRLDDPRLPENTPPLHVQCRSLLQALTVYDYPDGLLTSHEFDEVPSGIQRESDIEEFRKILDTKAEVPIQESTGVLIQKSPDIESLIQKFPEIESIIKEYPDIPIEILLEMMPQENPVKETIQTTIDIPKAQTIAEANRLAVELGIAEYANFGELDVETANEIIENIKITQNMFPNLMKLEFVGSMAARNGLYGFTDEEGVAGAFRKLGYGENARGLLAYSSFGGRENMLEARKKAVRSLDCPIGTDSIKGLIDHEIGHWIDNSYWIREDERIKKLFDAFHMEDEWYTPPSGLGIVYGSPRMGPDLSNYANRNIKEFIAEGWTEYRNNPNPRSLSEEIGNIIMEHVQKK